MEQEPEIYITWGFYNESHYGNMRVLLNPFLLGDGRTITKAKKLIKYIRESNEPEQAEHIKDFIEQFNADYEGLVQGSMLLIRSLEGKICKAEINLQRYRTDRDRVKKFLKFKELNPEWEKLNDRVAVGKADLAELKDLRRTEIRKNDKRMKDKAFLDQVLALLS